MGKEIQTSRDSKDYVLREQVRLVMQQLPTMQTASLIVALVLSYAVRNIVPHVNIIAWALMILLIVVGRIALYHRFRGVRDKPFAGEYWRNIYLILALFSGLIWGLSAFMVFPAGNPELISIFVLVIASLSATTTISHSSVRFGPTAWAGPAMLLYAVRCFMEGGQFGYTTGLLIILYLITVLHYSFTHNRSVTSAIALKFENLELLDEVRKANDRLRSDIDERKRTEDALRLSEERFAKAFHASPAPLAITRLVDGYVFDVNESFLRQFGFGREDVIGRMSSDVVLYGFPEERDEFLRLLRSRGKIHEHEVRLRAKSGDDRRVLISAEMSQIQGEECILTLLIDITERRQAEEALRESEARFRSIYQNSMEGILLTVPDGCILSANPTACRLLGYSEEEIIGLGRSGIVDVNDPQLPLLIQQRALSGMCRGELTLIRKDGTRFLAELSSELFRDEHGRTLSAMIIRDVTERKRAEEALRESERKYRELVETLQEGIWVIDKDANTTFVNPRMAEILGYTPDEMQGLPLFSFMDDQSVEMCRSNIERRRQGIREQHEFEFLRKDGSRVYATLVTGPIMDAEGNYCGAIAGVQDITGRKQAEEERIRLERELQQMQKTESLARMAGAIAHNFNNLLMAIMGNLELALYDLPQDVRARKNITGAMKASRRAAEISRFMLASSGQTVAKQDLLDLAEATREMLTLLSTSLPRKVRVSTNFPAPGPGILADGAHVKQILTNLVLNAVEAMGEKDGEITLDIQLMPGTEIRGLRFFPSDWEPKAKSYACLSVSDTGCGLDPDTQGRIFDPFFSTKFTGRGLGLPVMLGLVRANGGAITVESELGLGATFRVFFPLPSEQMHPTRKEEAPVSCLIDGRVLILVVDDEPVVLDMAKSMLGWLGYGVVAVSNGFEAVEILRARTEEISLVLLDLSMPGMNGWETLAALRALRPDIPVVLASGYDEAQVMGDKHPERPQAFLQKPYMAADLKAALDAAWKKPSVRIS